MKPNEYQQAAMRTEYTPCIIGKAPPSALTFADMSRVMHASMGLVTEAGELMDMLKKHLMYGKPFDKVNLSEELGDCAWYLALAATACGLNLEDIMAQNIAKLRARYPEKFEAHQALVRDLEKERAVLEQHGLSDS